MGVTHHWRRPTELPADSFRAAVADVRRLLSAATVEIGGFDGTGSPILRDDRIVFNGLAPLACEPFEVATVEFDRHGRNEVCEFCKTGHLPYDLQVKATLIVLEHHLHPHFVVTSDQADEEWAAARDLVQSALGYGSAFCLSNE